MLRERELLEDIQGLCNEFTDSPELCEKIKRLHSNATIILNRINERKKELQCMYEVGRIIARQEGLDEIFQKVAESISLGWQYPDICCCRISLNDKEFCSTLFKTSRWQQTSRLIANSNSEGAIEVFYTEERPEADEGPFLYEERELLDNLAQILSIVLRSKQEEEQRKLAQAQLLHADRLATIGQLAAGVAHELNEPLGNILGFAQLGKKTAGLPSQIFSDLEKIEAASLYAREIIRKLVTFARQSDPEKKSVDLNRLVRESILIFSTRCQNRGIKIKAEFPLSSPVVYADISEMKQIVTNLVVNAIQAMPKGGELTISTGSADEMAFLAVSDTGVGMSKEVAGKIFDPFFTTKDIDEGTGLGLSVVHGIVTSNQGQIEVMSEVDEGTYVKVLLPLKNK